MSMNSVQGKLTALFVTISVAATLVVGLYFIYETWKDNDAANAAYRKNLEEH